MAFFVFVLWTLSTQTDTLKALLWTPLWFVVIGAGYLWLRRTPEHEALRAAHAAKLAEHARAE